MPETPVDIYHIVTSEVTAVDVKVKGPHGYGTLARAFGSAKRHPTDAPNESLGYTLALSRALRNAADQLEAVAIQTIVNNS